MRARSCPHRGNGSLSPCGYSPSPTSLFDPACTTSLRLDAWLPGMMTTSEPTLFPVERDPRLRLILPGVVAMGFTLEGLDSTIITTAIPTMARSLHTTPLLMNLSVTTYVLVLAVFIPISGWLADRFGARRVFASALLTFSLGSSLCGLSVNLPLLIGARAIQGLGGAMMTPVGRLVLLRSFPRDQYVAAMTYMTLPAVRRRRDGASEDRGRARFAPAPHIRNAPHSARPRWLPALRPASAAAGAV